MNARLFDVFHHPADQCQHAVRERVDIDFDRVFQKLVDEDRTIRRCIHRLGHIARDRGVVVTNLHRPAAEHVAGTDQHGIANFIRDPARPMRVGGHPVGGLPQTQAIEDFLEPLAIFGRIDHVRAGPDDVDAGGFQSARQIERRLSAELHDDSVRLHAVANVEHVLGRERFEEQQVRRVVVGRDRFRVRVDHDAFDAQLAQRERSLTAAVVEFDPLPDAIGAASQDDDPFAIALRRRLVLGLVRRVVVRGVGFEFGRAGVDLFERRDDAE